MLCNNLLDILGTVPVQDSKPISERIPLNKSSKLIVHKKPDNLIKKIKKANKINLETNLNIITRWKTQNFMEFNHWLQVSKADFRVEYQSLQDNRSFICTAYIKLPSVPKEFSNSGIGNTKKLSKLNAIENILIEISKKNCLQYGLKSNTIINEVKLKENEIKRKKTKKKVKQNSTIKLMVENINNLLGENKFIFACKIFCQILILKQVTWEEISGIWLYCIFKQKIEYMKSILDLIAIYNKKHCSIKENNTINYYSNNDELINEELKQKYGFYRINNDNLFDNYDPFNYYAGKSEFISDEEPKKYDEINTEFKLYTDSDTNLIQKEYVLKDVIPIVSLTNNNLETKGEIQGIKVPLSLKLSNYLYDSLLYNLNFNFSLSISELLYSSFAISENFFHKNSSDYFLHKKNLLIIDLIEKISRRMKKELIEYNLKLESIIDDKINYEIKYKFVLLQNNSIDDAICEDDLVYISFGELKENRQGFIGIIYKKDNSSSNQILIKSFLDKNFITTTKNHSNFFLKKLASKKKYDMLGDDLTNFIRNNCCSQEISDVIFQNSSDKSLLNVLKNSINEENQKVFFIPKFNSTQNEALNKALTQKLTIIEGPSTSGKTTLAAEIINQWIKINKSQILVCSSDKDSTDILHCMLLNYGLKLYRYNGYPKETKISDFDIICSHIINSNDDYLNEINFSRIIIDNSNQITEMDVISKLTKKCQQLVLIGDSKQFSYANKSDLLRSKGIQISLFERLIKQNNSSILLNVQYKIPLSIFLYSNYSFYNQSIQNSNSNDFTKCLDSFKWPNKDVNFSFLHVKGNEKNYKNSIINKNEIYIIKELLSDIIKQKEYEKIKISVVTYYKAQRNELKKLISTLLTENEIIMNSIIEIRKEIGTYLIDDFINKDSDLIICSMVRSNSKGIVGYLKDYRKLNSLLSRTRKGLIIVGDVETLSFDRILNNFLFWAKVNNLIMKK